MALAEVEVVSDEGAGRGRAAVWAVVAVATMARRE